MNRGVLRLIAAASSMYLLCGSDLRAEVIDEIAAKVNDEIVTKSELDTEEQGMLQELYRRYSGTELDAQVKDAKGQLLRRMIDRKVLIQRAAHIFDMTKMQEYYIESFKEQQNIKSDKELEKLLTQQNMTMADMKQRLVEEFAPQQVVRAEVAERIAVSDKDARAYYDGHPANFTVPAEATAREIVLKSTAADRTEKRAQADAVRARVAAEGADFAAVAAEVSDAGTKKAGGLLGTVKKGDLAAALEAAVFTLPVGEVSSVLEADYGFHILKVETRTEESLKPFDAVKAEIEAKIQSERFSVEYKAYLQKAWSEATIWISPKYQDRLSAVDPTN